MSCVAGFRGNPLRVLYESALWRTLADVFEPLQNPATHCGVFSWWKQGQGIQINTVPRCSSAAAACGHEFEQAQCPEAQQVRLDRPR